MEVRNRPQNLGFRGLHELRGFANPNTETFAKMALSHGMEAVKMAAKQQGIVGDQLCIPIQLKNKNFLLICHDALDNALTTTFKALTSADKKLFGEENAGFITHKCYEPINEKDINYLWKLLPTVVPKLREEPERFIVPNVQRIINCVKQDVNNGILTPQESKISRWI